MINWTNAINTWWITGVGAGAGVEEGVALDVIVGATVGKRFAVELGIDVVVSLRGPVEWIFASSCSRSWRSMAAGRGLWPVVAGAAGRVVWGAEILVDIFILLLRSTWLGDIIPLLDVPELSTKEARGVGPGWK